MIDLSERRIIVTGGASGIGAACVAGFAEAGASVVSLDVDERGSDVAAAADAGRGRCTFMRCDVSSQSQVNDVFDSAAQWLGGLDVLAHIAGIVETVPAEDITDAQFRRVIDINLMGTIYVDQAAFRLMPNGGRIINTGSPAGIRPNPGVAHYSASKGAVMAWTRSIAAEWGPKGILVNTVVPEVLTPMALRFLEQFSPEERDAMLQAPTRPTGPMRTPETAVVPLMLFLASEASDYITGQAISATGGSVMIGA